MRAAMTSRILKDLDDLHFQLIYQFQGYFKDELVERHYCIWKLNNHQMNRLVQVVCGGVFQRFSSPTSQDHSEIHLPILSNNIDRQHPHKGK